MKSTVPWGKDVVAEGTRPSDVWGDAVNAERGGGLEDHRAEMQEIAEQLRRLSGAGQGIGRDLAALPRGIPAPARGAGASDAVRDAVAEISRRQADLDRRGEAPSPSAGAGTAALPSAVEPAQAASAPRRAEGDLAAEVAQTFARFSEDLREAVQASDARPQVAALDRQVRQIGRAVDGLGVGLADPGAISRIGEQTREMHDLLKASAARPVPFDGVEHHVATLEARLGRLASLPETAPPPDFRETMEEVRSLLDGFKPGAAMATLEARLDGITDRIERGLDARGPAGLIEGLSRRVDEIHASLRSQLAASAVDTRPLESLVRGLSDRIGQAREASTDFGQLEVAVRDIAAKIDGGGAAADPRGIQAVEVQLARLSDRLDRSEASLRGLDGVEHALADLFSQFEVTRQVAIDAAETAARTAARDTLRAALQNPSLAQRHADMPSGFADHVTRGLDDLRASQDSSERRTWSALSDIQAAMERLARRLGDAPPADEPRRRAAAGAPAVEPARSAFDPADELIEPGAARSLRAEPRFGVDLVPQAEAAPAADGPATFIAAARRAARAAQSSAAAERLSERRASPRAKSPGGTVALSRARQFLARRRRPILLGLAALVLLVGALEVVKLSAEAPEARRAAVVETPPARAQTASLAAGDAASPPARSGALPVAVLPPAAAPAPPPLPSFVAGPAKAQAAATDGIAEGLRAQAAAGNPAAQYEVGARYADGRGIARDAKQADAWFEKAAAQGLAPAEYRLGSAYEKGAGVDRDPALAMSWYGKAAEAGNVRAMHNLAVMSAEGAGGKPDYAKAAQWFGKASTYGVRDSQFNLAILYARGLGIEQSLPQSYTWFAIAAAGGDEDAAKKRDEVAGKLDAKVLASSKAAADAFRAAAPPAAANEVSPPPGGWDGAAPRAAPAKLSQL